MGVILKILKLYDDNRSSLGGKMEEDIAILSKSIESHYIAESLNISASKHLLDEHFTLVAANNRYYEMFGYEKEEYVRLFKNRPDLYYADDPEGWEELTTVVTNSLKNGDSGYTFIGRIRHKDGRKIWVRLVAYFIDEYVNGYQVSYSVMMDISDLMQSKIERDVTQNIFPGLISKYQVTDTGYKFLEGNQKFYKMFENTKLSFRYDEVDEVSELNSICNMYDDFRKGISKSFTVSPKDKNGQRYYLKVSAECIDWISNDPIYLLLYTDITDLTLQSQKLEEYNRSVHRLAYSDEVTGGFNRRKFEQAAYETINNSQVGTFSMVWMNLQKFKVINDINGIEAGDRILKYIYKKIDKLLNDQEYVARLFSDNFVILLKEQDNQKIATRLQNIAFKINSFNINSEYKYYLTFVCGVYHIVDTKLPITTIEDRANTALKSVDSMHSDFCRCNFYTDEIRFKLLQEKEIENIMRDSLKKKEFQIYLQPKYSLKLNKIYGAEALIRWIHPIRGLLSPAEFIPLFERNGFIIDIDLYVFEEVCILIRKWLDEGKDVHPISVNMSRAHFVNNDFFKDYIRIKNKYGISSKYIEIELTETMVFEDPEMFSKIIEKIHQAGFKCSMDDFGSGYSSLNLLKDLELDTVKLDRAFFSSEMMENVKENIIVKSIIDMTKALNMLTVAEGIESKQQTEFLNNTACDFIQGYVISKPVTIREFENMIEVNT